MIRKTDMTCEEIVSLENKLRNSGLVNLLQTTMQFGSILNVNDKNRMILFRYDEYVEKRLAKIFDDYQWEVNRQNSYKYGKYEKLAKSIIDRTTKDMKDLENIVNEIKRIVDKYGRGFYVESDKNEVEVFDLAEVTKYEYTHIGGRKNEQSRSY